MQELCPKLLKITKVGFLSKERSKQDKRATNSSIVSDVCQNPHVHCFLVRGILTHVIRERVGKLPLCVDMCQLFTKTGISWLPTSAHPSHTVPSRVCGALINLTKPSSLFDSFQ